MFSLSHLTRLTSYFPIYQVGTECLPYFPWEVVVRTKGDHISGSAWETDLLPPAEWDLMLLFVPGGASLRNRRKAK